MPGMTTSGRRSIGGRSASRRVVPRPHRAQPARLVDLDPAVALVAGAARAERREDARPEDERRARGGDVTIGRSYDAGGPRVTSAR